MSAVVEYHLKGLDVHSSGSFWTILIARWSMMQRRGTGQTGMEPIRPILMLSLQVLGWTRTTLDHDDAEVFANASLPMFEESTE